MQEDSVQPHAVQGAGNMSGLPFVVECTLAQWHASTCAHTACIRGPLTLRRLWGREGKQFHHPRRSDQLLLQQAMTLCCFAAGSLCCDFDSATEHNKHLQFKQKPL